MKEVLLVLAISMGFSLPLQAQSALPVQVICTKTQGVYKPICGHMKQAVSSSAEFRPAKNGNRYIVLLFAKTPSVPTCLRHSAP